MILNLIRKYKTPLAVLWMFVSPPVFLGIFELYGFFSDNFIKHDLLGETQNLKPSRYEAILWFLFFFGNIAVGFMPAARIWSAKLGHKIVAFIIYTLVMGISLIFMLYYIACSIDPCS